MCICVCVADFCVVTKFMTARDLLTFLPRRYYKFMFLKATYPERTLSTELFSRSCGFIRLTLPASVPTMDIYMVWQAHAARPALYEADCKRLFGVVRKYPSHAR